MRQDYVMFGSSAPIVLAPYETIPIGGVPTIRVWDPEFYIQVRDILIANQLGQNPSLPLPQTHWGVGRAPETGSPEAQGIGIQGQAPSTSEAHIAHELRLSVDQMLGALSARDLLKASAVLCAVLGLVGGGAPELQQLVGIYGKILAEHLKADEANKTKQADEASEGNTP